MTRSVLLVGLGQIGMGYDLAPEASDQILTHARAIELHPAFSLAAAVDPEGARREQFEGRYGRAAYADLVSALREHRPEVVVIAGPTPQHAEILAEVLRSSSPTAILCEKPLAYDLHEARSMVAAATAGKVPLYANYMRRSDPGAFEVKRRIAEGEIAGPIKGVAWYSKGFLHSGSHLFNLLEYWLGPFVDGAQVAKGRIWNGVDPEPDVAVNFTRGTVVFLAARDEDYSHFSLELVAANGRLRCEARGQRVEWQPVAAGRHSKHVLSATPELIASGMDRYQWHVMDQLARSLDGHVAEICTGEQALATLESMHRLLETR